MTKKREPCAERARLLLPLFSPVTWLSLLLEACGYLPRPETLGLDDVAWVEYVYSSLEELGLVEWRRGLYLATRLAKEYARQALQTISSTLSFYTLTAERRITLVNEGRRLRLVEGHPLFFSVPTAIDAVATAAYHSALGMGEVRSKFIECTYSQKGVVCKVRKLISLPALSL